MFFSRVLNLSGRYDNVIKMQFQGYYFSSVSSTETVHEKGPFAYFCRSSKKNWNLKTQITILVAK